MELLFADTSTSSCLAGLVVVLLGPLSRSAINARRRPLLRLTADAPWTIVRSDDKKRARLNAIKFILHSIPYDTKDTDVVTAPDPHIVGSAKAIYEHGENPHTHAPADHAKAGEDHPKAKAATAGH